MIKGAVRSLPLLAFACAMALAYANRDHWDRTALEGGLADVGSAAPLLFIGLYALATVLFLPGSILTLTGGALFGPVWGTLYSLTGATFGAVLAFLVARYLSSGWDQARFEADAGGRAEHSEGLILDVRTAMDFVGEQGHITGAVNIPLEELEARLAELGDDPERPIAIICRTDRRSSKAAALLARRGFANARVVRGGMTAWLAIGWPSEGQSHSTNVEVGA